MEGYHTGPHVMQGPSMYQGSPYLMQMQQSSEIGHSSIQVFPNQNVQLVRPTTRVSDGFNITKIANEGITAQPRNKFGDKTYISPYSKISVVKKPVKNASTVSASNIQSSIQHHQTTSSQQLNLNVNRGSGINNSIQMNFSRPEPAEVSVKWAVKIPEVTKVTVNSVTRNKVGSIRIFISGSFLSWSASDKTILDLNFMRCLFDISNVDLIIKKSSPYETGIYNALKNVVDNKILSDWLILKCEEKQIPFFKVNDQIDIFSVTNFTTLLRSIAQESCLPLPFIMKGEGGKVMYFYVNFQKRSREKVKKLNVPIFHDADNGKKKLPCKYPGIRLDSCFERAHQRFVFHVHKPAHNDYKAYTQQIRQFIIYNHIMWGFLQAWIRRVKEQYNGCFKMEDIVTNISLCQLKSKDMKGTKTNNEIIYPINYMDFYLKFDPVTLKEAVTTFSVENFETNYVCDVPIVQYYRQFFLINDMHYSDALKNLLLYSNNSQGSSTEDVTEVLYMPAKHDTDDKINQKFSLPGGISRTSTHTSIKSTEKQQETLGIVMGDLNTVVQEKNWKIVDNVNPPNSINKQNSREKMSGAHTAVESQEYALHHKTQLVRPLIKTRTVEEINSSVAKGMTISGSVHYNKPGAQATIVRNHVDAKGGLISIQETLNQCYLRNRIEISETDESTRAKVIFGRFYEALDQAMEMETVDSFIETIYLNLQLHFTNATCKKIMDKMIFKALSRKFPNLKFETTQITGASNESNTTSAGNRTRPNVTSTVNTHQNVREPVPETPHTFPKLIGPFILYSPDMRGNIVHNTPSRLPVYTESQMVVKSTATLETSKAATGQEQSIPPTCIVKYNSYSESNGQGRSVLSEQANDLLKSIPKQDKILGPAPTELNVVSNPVTEGKERSDTVAHEPEVLPCDSNPVTEGRDRSETVAHEPEIFPYDSNPVTEGKERSDTIAHEPEVLPYDSNSVTEGRDRSETVAHEPEVLPRDSNPVKETRLNENKTNTELSDQNVVNAAKEDKDNTIIPVSALPYEVPVDAEGRTTPCSKISNCLETEESEPRLKLAKYQEPKLRYKLRPCSVVLNACDVTNYFESLRNKAEGKKTHRCDEDESSAAETRPRKRTKVVSELEFMEARTRVLQKLRKRRKMYTGGADSEKRIYTSEELVNFIVRRSCTGSVKIPSYVESDVESDIESDEDWFQDEAESVSQSSGSSQPETESEVDNFKRMELDDLKEECLRRKAKVVLVRLEVTPLYDKYSDCLKPVEHSQIVRTRLTPGSHQENDSNLKYFDLKHGKLYLKKQYYVLNGVIVPANPSSTMEDRTKLKKEPLSPQQETDFSSTVIKEEHSLE